MEKLKNLPTFEQLKARGDAAQEETRIVVLKLHAATRRAAKLRNQIDLEIARLKLRAVTMADFDVSLISIVCAGGINAQFELERFASDDFSEAARLRADSSHRTRPAREAQL